MGRIKLIFILISFLTLTFISCSLLKIEKLFERGKTADNGQYVPKKERFRLKDKNGHIFPVKLDTSNIYKLVAIQDYNSNKGFEKTQQYIKFFKNGRCLGVSIPLYEGKSVYRHLKETDLNPNNSFCEKKYYYSPDGKTIKIESFVYGEGYGKYVILDYILSTSGDSIFLYDKYLSLTYKKEKIPAQWQKYSIDW